MKIIYTTEDGFKWAVLPFEDAKKLFCAGTEVYKLYEDQSDALCVESDFDEEPEEGVIYAIEHNDETITINCLEASADVAEAMVRHQLGIDTYDGENYTEEAQDLFNELQETIYNILWKLSEQ